MHRCNLLEKLWGEMNELLWWVCLETTQFLAGQNRFIVVGLILQKELTFVTCDDA